jgi:hypothetical protein
MNVNKVHHVTTINRVAEDLGADDDRLRDANEMEIEDGAIWSMASENLASRPSVCEFRSKSPIDSEMMPPAIPINCRPALGLILVHSGNAAMDELTGRRVML